MSGETTLTVVGNLTDDPELRFTPSGAAVAKFRIASTPSRFDKQQQKFVDMEPLFLDCTVWRQAAEHVAESLQRGARVIVTGRLKQENWEDKNGGGKRSKIVMDVDEIGPSLRYATAKVQKMARSSAGGDRQAAPVGGGADDPWSTGAAPASAGSTASGFDSEPPF